MGVGGIIGGAFVGSVIWFVFSLFAVIPIFGWIIAAFLAPIFGGYVAARIGGMGAAVLLAAFTPIVVLMLGAAILATIPIIGEIAGGVTIIIAGAMFLWNLLWCSVGGAWGNRGRSENERLSRSIDSMQENRLRKIVPEETDDLSEVETQTYKPKRFEFNPDSIQSLRPKGFDKKPESSILFKDKNQLSEVSDQLTAAKEQLETFREKIKDHDFSPSIITRKEEELETKVIDLELEKDLWEKKKQKQEEEEVESHLEKNGQKQEEKIIIPICPNCENTLMKQELKDNLWCEKCDIEWTHEQLGFFDDSKN